MGRVVADTSALVSLGTVTDHATSPLDLLLDSHHVTVPERVLDEVRDTATYDDPSGVAAGSVLDRQSQFDVRSAELDQAFPLDDGENAAVTIANEIGATQLLCDEFNQLALVHASLAETRLVTTPSLLLAFAQGNQIDADTALVLLDAIGETRSWETNAYVERAKVTLE